MRNSLLPVAAAVLLFALGLLLVHPTVDRGQGGPAVEAGILALPTRNPIRTASQPLAGSTAAHLEGGARDDGRWRVVVITAADREAMTRSVMLALGETLYRAGTVVIMDPAIEVGIPSPPLPLPADRVLRIASSDVAGTADLAGEWTAHVLVELWQPRLPDGHPAAAWQPPPEGGRLRCRVEHRGRPAAAGGWPGRWAATGRAIAGAALASLVPPGGVRLPEGQPPDWGTSLPMPPQTDVAHWDACFQDDLVRGWTGAIRGRSVPTAEGGSESAFAPMTRRLAAGKWKPEAAAGAWQVWSRPKDGITEWFAARPVEDGWELTLWLERPGVPDLVRGWIAAARGGDAAARQRLARVLAVPALPEGLRQAAAQP